MQVFIPHSDYKQSVASLDSKRLRKQSLECCQILNTLLFPTEKKGWINHPAVKMWADCPGSLVDYLYECLKENRIRGFKTDWAASQLQHYNLLALRYDQPIWLGDEEIHSSHRARLLQKGFEEKLKYGDKAHGTIDWYKQFNWDEMQNPELFTKEYIWATNITETTYDKEIRVSNVGLSGKSLLISKYGNNPYITL